MKLTPVDQIPKMNGYHKLQELIEEFTNGDAKIVKVEFSETDYKSPAVCRSCLAAAIKRSKRPVKVPGLPERHAARRVQSVRRPIPLLQAVVQNVRRLSMTNVEEEPCNRGFSSFIFGGRHALSLREAAHLSFHVRTALLLRPSGL